MRRLELATFRVCASFRFEGPPVNSHVREGVVRISKAMSAEGAEQIASRNAISAGLRASGIMDVASTSSRTWLLNVGPSDLGQCRFGPDLLTEL